MFLLQIFATFAKFPVLSNVCGDWPFADLNKNETFSMASILFTECLICDAANGPSLLHNN
jgi:hypothetical protein